MSLFVSRRSILKGTGYLGAASLLRSIPAWAQAAPNVPVVLSSYYLSNGGAKFDRMQFRDSGVAHLRSIYGDSIERIELRTAPRVKRNDAGPSAQKGEALPPVLAIASMWVKNLEAFGAATLKAGESLPQGMKGISNGQVALQWEQVIAGEGDARESVAQGSTCFVSLYVAKPGGTFDEKYLAQTYVPKVKEAYGPDALRRIEVCKGVSLQGGGAPAFVGAVNMYIKDKQLFNTKGMQAGMALMAEGPKFTNLVPVIGTFDVYAVG